MLKFLVFVLLILTTEACSRPKDYSQSPEIMCMSSCVHKGYKLKICDRKCMGQK